MTKAQKFSAAPQLLGYLHQVRVALLLALEGEEGDLLLESLDDVELKRAKEGRKLIQVKHGRTASLTNSSPDLWRTIRVWSSLKPAGHLEENASLVLLTTGRAVSGSAAAYLRNDSNRSPEQAHDILMRVARDSENKALEPCFAAFKSLDSSDRRFLVEAIYIQDASVSEDGIREEVEKRLRLSVKREHRSLLAERLEGWWLGRATELLLDRSSISRFEVQEKVVELSYQFQPDALPIDFLGAEPAEPPDASSDTRIFVRQLRLISVGISRIEKAILDYYRAFEQRARWTREELVFTDDLAKYEDKLIDEWERIALALGDEYDEKKIVETEFQRIGREIYNQVHSLDLRIRDNVPEPYVMRGSYQMLADAVDARVYWHPQFRDRIRKVLISSDSVE